MRQYSVYAGGGGLLLLDVQANFVDIGTRMVAPLVPEGPALPRIPHLEPVFEIAGRPYLMRTAEMVAVRVSALKGAPVADLSPHHDQITRALDMLFHGF